MKLPQFNAESSLGPTMGIYQGKAVHFRISAGQVHPQQFGSLVATPICSPLLNQLFPAIEPCSWQGVPGIRECTYSCDLFYGMVLEPVLGGGISCKLQSSTCTRLRCGPCQPFQKL
jgi:hypothetical protein